MAIRDSNVVIISAGVFYVALGANAWKRVRPKAGEASPLGTVNLIMEGELYVRSQSQNLR